MTDIARSAAPLARAVPAGLRPLALGVAVLALAACDAGSLDWDLRSPRTGATTTEAARQATADRPRPDARGVISYPGYQVVVARRGETVSGVAQRLGLDAGELARLNAVSPDTALRPGEVLALPRRVAEPSAATGAPSGRPAGGVDVASIATTAIDRVEPGSAGPAATPAAAPRPAAAAGPEPVRHTVLRGETAFTIARLYNVSSRSLADWNGLGPDMAVREGQILMIPVAAPAPFQTAAAEPPPPPPPPAPGAGSPTPPPPSAAAPLPTDDPAVAPAPAAPPSPDLGAQRTGATPAARLAMPVEGRIIREFQKGRSDGISIGATAGAPVRAAADGTVATITRDTQQTQIVILRHSGNLLTVYANVDGLRVERGQQVRRGDQIGTVQAGDPPFLLFQVREGIESVDPMGYLR